MYRKLLIAMALIAGLTGIPGPGSAVELGLTPSQVFSLWTNVNSGLIQAAQVASDDSDWSDRLSQMTPRGFDGKTPGDVLEQVVAFRNKLNLLRQASGLKPVQEYGKGDGKVTPSVVFLNSGHVLDAMAGWLIENTEYDQNISPVYARNKFSGKTPSDVFGLVELAVRRLDQLLAKTGARG